MTVPAAQVLAFPGIDLETLAKLRARACDAFMRNDMIAFQEACMMMRRLIVQDVPEQQVIQENGARTYRYRGAEGRRRTHSPEARDRLSVGSVSDLPGAGGWEWAADGERL